MNILIIHEVDWLKKVSFEIHHLSELLSLQGHNVFAIDVPEPSYSLVNKQKLENYHRIYENASITLYRTPSIPFKGMNRISASFFSYKFIKKIIQENKIDFVLIYSIVTNAKAAIKVCNEFKIPIVHRTFDIIHDLIRENYLRKKVRKIEQDVYPKFDKVIANTPSMEQWAKDMGATDVILIPQGVDSNIMKPMDKDQQLLTKLGLSETDKIVLSLGSVESFSGVDSLIDKIPTILNEIPEFKLLVVGGGSHLTNLQDQVKKLNLQNKVIFTGYVPYFDVPKYCSIASLCVNTFRVNDMTIKLSPVKIFDMLSCAKVVISTPLKGSLYDFPNESNTVQYENLTDFHTKIIDLFKNDSIAEIEKNGRDYVQKNFTWNKVTEKFLNQMNSMKNITKS
ncbi:MAG: glycosyltransferase [Candidatus Nitrosopumilus sp. bin_7KS]